MPIKLLTKTYCENVIWVLDHRLQIIDMELRAADGADAIRAVLDKYRDEVEALENAINCMAGLKDFYGGQNEHKVD